MRSCLKKAGLAISPYFKIKIYEKMKKVIDKSSRYEYYFHREINLERFLGGTIYGF